MLEKYSKNHNLHFRRIPEDFGKTDFEGKLSNLLQDYLKIQGDFPDTDQIYIMNSNSVSKNRLPQNILVMFTHKKTRYTIMNKQRGSTLMIHGISPSHKKERISFSQANFAEKRGNISLENPICTRSFIIYRQKKNFHLRTSGIPCRKTDWKNTWGLQKFKVKEDSDMEERKLDETVFKQKWT